MKILVISDTHGHLDRLKMILEKESPIDMLIHCGDIEGQENAVTQLAGCPCHMVSGNNDWASWLSREITTEICGHTFFITHGHRYGVSLGKGRIREEALSRGVDICLFGHTHKPCVDADGRLILMNPGSLSYPRQIGRKPTYGIIEIEKEKNLQCNIRQLD